jgi:predicted aspartyl protease
MSKLLAAFVALLGLSGAASAQTCALPLLAASADLKPLPGSDLMTVPVEVNGTPKQFLLDIGTNPTEISQAAVAQLGLPETTKRTENIGADSGNMQARGGNLSALTNGGLGSVSVYDVRDKTGAAGAQTRVRITSFTIGRATGKSLQFLVANDAEMGKSEPYDGLLTGDFFKQYDVELDFGGRQINYLTPTKCTDPDKVVLWPHSAVAVIPMTMADGKIGVPVSVQGHQVNAVIDTSSPRTVMRRDIAELIVGLKADTPEMMPVSGLSDGKGQPVYGHTFSQIAFPGGVAANNVPTLIQANSLTREINGGMVLGSHASSTDARIPDLTLGMDVLHQLHLYVVYGQKNLYATSAAQ